MSSKKVPENDLDKAIMALGRSRSALPRFMRALAEGELWFLMAYHPDIEGETLELKNGMRNPFVEIRDAGGKLVPVFSSYERLEEALRAGKVKPKTYSAGSMKAVLLLEVLAKMKLRTVLNKSCKTGEVELPLNLMEDIADGSAFETAPLDGPRKQNLLSKIDPADYPTDLLQPVFEILRQHPNFRAAWIFHYGDAHPTAAGGRHYQFLIDMEPRDEAIYHDLKLVLASACCDPDEADSGLVPEDGKERYLADLWRNARPFYVAPDHQPPAGGGNNEP